MPTPVESPRKRDDENSLYVAKVNILKLFEGTSVHSKSYLLSHAFQEPFDIIQIYIKDKENLAYTLCENKHGEQFITVWNFKKELMLCYKQLKKKIKSFIVYPGKSDHILMFGDQYFKSWDINFTNKSFKENSQAMITMRLEKENDFVALEFIKGTEIFILLSKTSNQMFMFQKKVLINHLTDYKELENKSDNSDKDSFAEGIDDITNDEQDGRVFNQKGKAKFSQDQNKSQRKTRGHDINIKDKIGGVNFLINEENLKDPEFESFVATQKYLIIGTKSGYLILFEKTPKHSIKYVGKVRLSDRYITIRSLVLNPKEDILAITAICPYQVEELETPEGENPDQPLKFNPPDLKVKEKGKSPHTFLFTHKKLIKTKKEYKYKERVELLYVSVKSLVTSLTHASFKKIFNKGIHNGCVFQMSVCRNKSILVTLGEDSMKVFNHTNEWGAHATFEFEEQPLCIDLHPSGNQISVGFKTGTRLYQLLDNELKLSFEKFGKATICIAFSKGGHILAASKFYLFLSF